MKKQAAVARETLNNYEQARAKIVGFASQETKGDCSPDCNTRRKRLFTACFFKMAAICSIAIFWAPPLASARRLLLPPSPWPTSDELRERDRDIFGPQICGGGRCSWRCGGGGGRRRRREAAAAGGGGGGCGNETFSGKQARAGAFAVARALLATAARSALRAHIKFYTQNAHLAIFNMSEKKRGAGDLNFSCEERVVGSGESDQ